MSNRRIRASTRRHPILGLAAVLVVFALAAAPAAIAASPTADQYGSRSQQIAAAGAGGPSGGGAPTSAQGNKAVGGLPFTGLDLGLMALVAVALVGGGFALRRASHPAKRSS